MEIVDVAGTSQHPVAVRDDADEKLRCLVLGVTRAARPGDIRGDGPQATVVSLIRWQGYG